MPPFISFQAVFRKKMINPTEKRCLSAPQKQIESTTSALLLSSPSNLYFAILRFAIFCASSYYKIEIKKATWKGRRVPSGTSSTATR